MPEKYAFVSKIASAPFFERGAGVQVVQVVHPVHLVQGGAIKRNFKLLR